MISRKLIFIASFVLITILPLTACTPHSSNPTNSTMPTSPIYPIKTDLQNASKIIGVTLPVPTYFPENYYINGVEVTESNSVTIYISKKTSTPITPSASSIDTNTITLQISWEATGGPFGIKLEGERVNVAGVTGGLYSDGIIVDRGDHNDLWWDWRPITTNPAYFEFVISANKNISTDELVLIARSIRQ